MKKITSLFLIIALVSFVNTGYAQDSKRTTETKVADLLARVPAISQEAFNTVMANMLSLDESGLDMICRQIVAPGTGDDTRARYAVSGMSSFLSKKPASERTFWETICIRYAIQSSDYDVKGYFINQLSLVGGDKTVEALAPSMADNLLCPVVISTLETIGSVKAAKVIAASLDSEKNPCIAQAVNALVNMGYLNETASFINCYEKGDNGVKKASLTALAMGGTEEAYAVLEGAAKKASYRWDPTCSVSSLLLYARTTGLKGNIKKMESITKTIIANCNGPESNSYRLSAMAVITEVKKEEALPMLIKAINDPDISVRGGVVRLALSIGGQKATKMWINNYAKASEQAKPDIVYLLGERGDALAVPLIYKAMEDSINAISSEAVTALAKLLKGDAVDPILSWINRCSDKESLNTASAALTTILNSTTINKVAAQLKQSEGIATGILVNLISWSGDKSYFETVLPYASSANAEVKSTALRALINLAAEKDQATLIKMIMNSVEKSETEALQEALAIAANSGTIVEKRSDVILASLAGEASKEKLIPVLAFTGGEKALEYVLNEFENGDADIRDICFSTLTGWKDYSASEALYKICASENKTYAKASFDAYIQQIQSAPVSNDNRLLLFKKIAPYALNPDSRADMVDKAGAIHSYPAFLFVLKYLDDEDVNVAAQAALALADIALPYDGGKEGLYGDIIKNGLQRSLELISGPESDYDKEKIRKYLASMQQGAEFIPTGNSGADNKLTEAEKSEGFVSLFNGLNLAGWVGDTVSYKAQDGCIVVTTGNEFGGNLYTENEYADFIYRFEFQLTPGANNGLGIRTPLEGDAAYVGMELQILDNADPIYANLKPYQYHGSVYGVIPARRDFQNPVGEWNYEEVIVNGTKIKVILNGTVIVDGDIAEARDNGTMDHKEHPGLKNNKGHIGFLGHGSVVRFKNIRIKTL